jgi:hypothetical protein
VIAAAFAAVAFEKNWAPTIIAAVIAFAGGSLITSIVGRRAEATERRRMAYSEAVEALVSWIEYPYRVRRRTSDNPATLDLLTELGHDLQERLACHQTWVAAECIWAGETYERVLAGIRGPCAEATKSAWEATPITAAAGMNLRDFGAGDLQPWVRAMRQATAHRFGWRRLVTWGCPTKIDDVLTQLGGQHLAAPAATDDQAAIEPAKGAQAL